MFVAVGCDNLLDTDNLVKKDSSNYPGNPKEAQEALTGCYLILAQINPSENPLMVYELLSDDRFGGAGDGDNRAHALNRLQKDDENMFSDFWKQYYAGIFRCNLLLESLDNVAGWKSDDDKDQVLGEVYYLRAYFYFEMCRMFGTVPLLTSTAPVNYPRADADKLFAQIASDLKAAIETLPDAKFGSSQAPALGHATKWAAEALMGRVFLFYTGYYNKPDLPLTDGGSIAKAEVIAWLDDCIGNSGHNLLMSDFRNLWPYSNELTKPDYAYSVGNNLSWVGETGANVETIFAIKFSSIASWSTNTYYANHMPTYFGLRAQNNYDDCFPYGLGWGVGTVSPELWDAWQIREPNDIRRAGSILNANDPVENVTLNSGDNMDMEVTGYWQKKYMPINAKTSGGTVNYSVPMYGCVNDVQLNNTQDVVVIRFADVLLMSAELKQDAANINLVRARVGLPSIGGYTDDALRYERRFELAFEGHRYHDLLRWGIAGQMLGKQNNIDIYNRGVMVKSNFGDLAKRISDTGGFMPIPQTQIDLSGNVLVQTPGWASSDAQFNF